MRSESTSAFGQPRLANPIRGARDGVRPHALRADRRGADSGCSLGGRRVMRAQGSPRCPTAIGIAVTRSAHETRFAPRPDPESTRGASGSAWACHLAVAIGSRRPRRRRVSTPSRRSIPSADQRRSVLDRDLLVHLRRARAKALGPALPVLPAQPGRERRGARSSGIPPARRSGIASTRRISGTSRSRRTRT